MHINNCPHSFFTLPHERVSESFIQNKIFNLADLSSDVQHLVGTLFGFYWDRLYWGALLGLRWDSIGNLLELYSIIGTLLGLYWDSFGTLLGFYLDGRQMRRADGL